MACARSSVAWHGACGFVSLPVRAMVFLVVRMSTQQRANMRNRQAGRLAQAGLLDAERPLQCQDLAEQLAALATLSLSDGRRHPHFQTGRRGVETLECCLGYIKQAYGGLLGDPFSEFRTIL